MRKLLWVGDAACPSGFARATHKTLDVLRETWDVTVLGLNYRGDPHDYPYHIYAAAAGGDWAGIGRLIWMCDLVKPDCIVIQNDPWNIPHYTKQLARFVEYRTTPIVGSIAVDGLNCRGKLLNPLALTIFWTDFAEQQARLGGFTGRSAVIPLGVDRTIYYPGDRNEARLRSLPPEAQHEIGNDPFLVGVIGRNQPRKRLDLTIAFFTRWIRRAQIENAYLMLHVGPTGDEGYDIKQLAAYYGILDRVLLSEPQPFHGVSEESMADVYRTLDVYFSTTQGEGMGLPAMEAMACGIPCVLPSWSAFADWAHNAAYLVPCCSHAVTVGGPNAIGGIMDEHEAIRGLQFIYDMTREERARFGARGLARVSEKRFDWRYIGERFRDEIDAALEVRQTAVA